MGDMEGADSHAEGNDEADQGLGATINCSSTRSQSRMSVSSDSSTGPESVADFLELRTLPPEAGPSRPRAQPLSVEVYFLRFLVVDPSHYLCLRY